MPTTLKRSLKNSEAVLHTVAPVVGERVNERVFPHHWTPVKDPLTTPLKHLLLAEALGLVGKGDDEGLFLAPWLAPMKVLVVLLARRKRKVVSLEMILLRAEFIH